MRILTPSKKLLSLKAEEADADIRRRMGLEEGEEVYVIKSIYYADGRPYCINTSILPRKLFPKLELFDFNHNSLYEVLKSFYQDIWRQSRTSLCSESTLPHFVCTMIMKLYSRYMNPIY